MGKPIDKNKPTKDLNELLEHLHKPGDDLDAFEQEALDGFASLESTQEAIDMKQRLDERMEEKFSKKRKPLFIYWSAAAGVALIISLVFLVRSNGDLKSEESLADNTVANEKLLENNINSPAPPPAELKNEATKDAKMAAGKADMTQGNASKGYQNGPVLSAEQSISQSSNEESSVVMDEVAKESGKEGEKDANDSRRSDNAKPLDDLASANKKQDQVPASAASGASSGDLNPNKQKAKDKEEESRDEDKATNYFSRKIKKEKKAEPAATETKPKSEIEGSYEKNNILVATLTIKESDLQQRLDKFFSDKDYKKSFVCTLTINSDNKVESIVFQNPDLFHKSETKEITEFFKKQKCFKNHEFSVYSTYTVNYKAQ